MKIRKATENEMLALWEYESLEGATPTAQFFYKNIKSGNADFWTLDDEGRLLGELYVFYNLEDKDFANGKDRAYLCAFRIEKELRGQGLGTNLIKSVMKEIKAQGYRTVTIGVDETEEANIRLYHRLGFQRKIKDCYRDPCARDNDMEPKPCSCFWLLSKDL